MSTKNLPGIKFVEYLPADETLLYPKQIPMPGSKISVIGEYTLMPTVELTACAVTDERVDAGLIYTTHVNGIVKDCDTLTTAQRHRLSEKFHTYRLTDVYGNKYQIGIDKKPFPEINFSPAIDGQSSGSRAIPFLITWKSTLPPLETVAL